MSHCFARISLLAGPWRHGPARNHKGLSCIFLPPPFLRVVFPCGAVPHILETPSHVPVVLQVKSKSSHVVPCMDFLFSLFSSVTLLSGVMVIQARNPVHSVLFLILVFFNAAGLLVLLGLDFFAMIFLVVYVGAIAVLFLFVVMMLNIKIAEIHERRLRYLPIGGVLGLLFLFQVVLIVDNELIPLLSAQTPGFVDWAENSQTVPTIQALGNVVYTYYFSFFLLSSLILLIAMIGAIVLTMQKGMGMKRQQVFLQNTREHAKTIRKIS